VRFEKELQFARSVAMHAGELALGYQSHELKPESKPDMSPVTMADKECERMIAARIEETFPDDGILGEEGSNKQPRNGRKWIVDPIDGTRDFVRGLPLWGTLIGLEVDGTVEVAVANLAPRRESYFAVRGSGAFLNDSSISISGIQEPGLALASVNGVNNIRKMPFASDFLDWVSQFWAVRSMGGCVDAMLLASGRAELWIEPHAQPWDLAALKVIIEEAGGRFLNFDGGSSIYGGNAAACVPALEATVRRLVVR
jgi:histidinol phosphatase-like enzyme (inositol monophosphatase family)